MSTFILTRRLPGCIHHSIRALSNRTFASSAQLSTTLNSNTISKITEKEKEITHQAQPVKGGPTAQAQKHVGQQLSSEAIADITKGERKVTGGELRKDGPSALAQSMATSSSSSTQTQQETHSGKLDSSTISKITAAEKEITGQDAAVKGGPTAQAQKHANQPITSEALHDITEGEKKITGGERVKGGPTSTAQSELGKSRSNGAS